MRVAVLDHGMGNIRSVAKALEVAGARVSVTRAPEEIESSDGLCIPGQGIFGRCMSALTSRGLDEIVRSWIERDRPFLGICLGMQVLFDSSEEGTNQAGLGIVGGRVTRLPSGGGIRVPHIGWSKVEGPSNDGEFYYFDHSYAVHPGDGSVVSGWCVHGDRFAASVERGSMMAVQFHPEKSADAGIRLLSSWVQSSKVAA